MTPKDGSQRDTGQNTETGGSQGADRDLILGALEQADRMVMSSVSNGIEDIGPDDRTSVDGPPSPSSALPGLNAAATRAAKAVRSRAVDLPPGFFPGYDVIREIHRGGQGVVFEGTDRASQDKVAIKLLHGGATSEGSAIARFEREVAVLQDLDDDGIVRVHGSGRTADGGFYYVMDYIAGEPLDVVVRRLRTGLMEAEPWEATRSKFTLFARSMTGLRSRAKRRAPTLDAAADPESAIIMRSKIDASTGASADADADGPTRVGQRVAPSALTTRGRRSRTSVVSAADPELRRLLELFAQVCDSVAAAHVRGVIHRDLKPANIRLDSRGNPILVDFGLAKLDASDGIEHTQMTQTGQFVGSMPWASPEQAAGEHSSVDVRSDVYSLGVILYQFLTGGRFPYKVVGSVREVLDAILYTEPARPSDWGRKVADELETIVLKALSKPRDRRYQSAGELGRDVRRYLAGEPIEAKRDSAWYVLSKTIQRHKAPTGIAATAIAASVAFSVVLGPLYLRANAAEELASRNFTKAAESEGDIRGLVRAFLYEIHPKVEGLTGATEARQALLETAVEYLGHLRNRMIDNAASGEFDTGLIADVAAAHDQVGDLYGSPFNANTGETERAGEHYREARRLREVLLAANPDDSEVLIGLGTNSEKTARWFQRTGQFDDAIGAAQDAERRFEQALAIDPSSEVARGGLARAIDALADQHRRLIASAPSAEEARANGQTAISLYGKVNDVARAMLRDGIEDPDGDASTNPRRILATGMMNTGLARLAVANKLFTVGEALEDEQIAETMLVEAQAERDDAMDLARDALARTEALSADRPEIHTYQRDLIVHNLTLGLAHERLARASKGDRKANAIQVAEACYSVGLSIAEAHALDVSDLEAQRDVGMLLGRLTALYTIAGELDIAAEAGTRSVEIRARIARSDPIVRHERDVAVGEFRMGKLAESRAKQAEAPTDLWEEAVAWYQRSLERFIGLADQGIPTNNEISELEGLIAKVEGQLAKAR
ncbi:MAG: serine/threonine-protein kinase [Planctomycetota bacterium]